MSSVTNPTVAHRRRRLAGIAVVAALCVVTAACGDDDDDADSATEPSASAPDTEPHVDTAPPTTEPPGTEPTGTEPDDGAIDPARCAANEEAGTITYLSGFDFAAAASILDVIVAEDAGYFDELCLDVELQPSIATNNYALLASGEAQFSSAGSYSEILNFSGEGATFVAFVQYGHSPIEALVTPEGGATELSQLEGATLGVKQDLPPSIVAMLAQAGLERGTDYEEVLLDGYDPVAHLDLDIDALPVYKSNEPRQLDAAGITYTLFDPTDEGIPGSFALLYTSQEFYDEHPTVVEDFARAALRGMETAIADPEAAVDMAIARIDMAGNQSFLTREGEMFRWEQEVAEVQRSTPAGQPIGFVDPDGLAAEYAAYIEAGVWPDGPPEDYHAYDADLAVGLYDENGAVIWPG